jgi:glycosyltransferase involved in cell wall biosynthesis
LRIAILTTSNPRHPGDPSGHFVETEARVLARERHEVHVIAPGHFADAFDRVDSGRQADGVRVWGAGAANLFGWPGALIRARERPTRWLELGPFAWNARQILARLAPLDRAIAHFLVPSGYPLAIGSAARLEVVAHGSDVRLLCRFPRPLRNHTIAALLRDGARFRFVSRDLKRELMQSLGRHLARALDEASHVELPHLAVPDVWGRVRKVRDALDLAPTEVLWVAVGRLLASKRVDRAVREAARAGVTLLVVGDGPERAALERLAASLGGRVRFLGHRPREEALAFVACADRLVHLSEAEGAPTVIREARALGIPVLAAPVGDVPDWAADDPGILLFPRDTA